MTEHADPNARVAGAVDVVDAVVVGAGVSGIYQLYRLLKDGLNVRTIEAAEGVGGVWYWNAYPGARVDSHFPHYQFFFAKELWEETDWSERFPSQPEIERYLNRVVDKYDLRQHIAFNTRVVSASYDESIGRWLVKTDSGEQIESQFVIFNTGGLFQPNTPDFVGQELFRGEQYHTSRWPREGVDLEGKRVGVFGTAATGIQVVQEIAPVVESLTVFQRTPSYAVAMKNPELEASDLEWMRDSYDRIYEGAHSSVGGFFYEDVNPRLFDEVPVDEREAYLESIWAAGDLRMWGSTFSDAGSNPEAAEYVSEFVRNKIRGQVSDAAVADKLTPKDYYFGTRRVPLENGYYRTFNRQNVHLVDIRDEPVRQFVGEGIQTDRQIYDLDVVIYATGFDAGVGAINQVDIRGLGNTGLRETWEDTLRTTVGMQVHGFPNLFMTMAPFAPAAAICNYPICSEHQCDWIADTIRIVREDGHQSIHPSAEVENAWMANHNAIASMSLLGKNPNSWYHRKNKDGSDVVLGYLGGLPEYRRVCDEFIQSRFTNFELQ